jgi:TetR/AcrR family transcriptional regulator, transcriptional repressor for nem operon
MKPRPEIASKPDTRREIIALADGLIRTRGYNAFSYGDLGVIMDVAPAAIHYHFRTKTGLGQEVVRQELFRIREFRRWNERLPGEEQLKHLFTIFRRNSEWSNICLMGSLLPAYATLDASMQKAVADLCNEIAAWVASCLEDARDGGRLDFQGTGGDRALLVVSTLLSSLLLARVQGKEVFVRMADQLLADLGAGWRVADLPADAEEWPAVPHSFT